MRRDRYLIERRNRRWEVYVFAHGPLPMRTRVRTFLRREDAEAFIREVQGHDVTAAA